MDQETIQTVQSEYESVRLEKQEYMKDLEVVVKNNGYILEGNCFYYNGTFDLYPDLYTKQLNLFWSGKQADNNICEIGFNAGHSAMLMLMGRMKTPINFTIFDICHHPYTKPAFEYLKPKFPHVMFELVEGDSTVTMSKWIEEHKYMIYKYDVVHVDGGHYEHCIFNDMKNADVLVKVNGIIIVDDTNNHTINSYVEQYLSFGNYIELNVLPTYGYPHRIIQKIK